MIKKLLKILLITFTFIFIIISIFIFYAGLDRITPNNISQKNDIYLSLRYYTLTHLFRSLYPKYNLEKVPVFEFGFKQDDIRHITKINNIVNPTPENFDHYNKINKWRENNLLYEGRNYKIKWKSHGKNPDRQDYRGLRSLNIKLLDGQRIFNSDHFRLIIYRRLSSDMKIIEYLAKEFNLITRKHRLIKVKIKGYGYRLFWFEKRYNNEFARNNNQASQIIISKPENKSHIIRSKSDRTNNETSLKKLIKKKKFSARISDSIINIYNNFNYHLEFFESDKIIKYVDTSYITSFLAARLISGCNYHGTLQKNLHIYFDTINFKFYPCFGRDEILSIIHSDSLEHHLNGNSHFIKTLLMNNSLRQLTYKKLFDFITIKEKIFMDSLYSIVDKHEKRHFPKWIHTTNGLTHLHTLPLINVNSDSIFKYLTYSFPTFNYSKRGNDLILNLRPNSNSALYFYRCFLENLLQSKSYNVIISKNNYENIIDSRNVMTSEKGSLNLAPLLKRRYFHNDLDTNLVQKNVSYFISVENIGKHVDSILYDIKLKNKLTQEFVNFNIYPQSK